MSGQRRLLIFVVKVFVLILIFSSFWPFVAPGYANLLATASNGISPSSISITAVDSNIVIQHQMAPEPLSLRSLPFQAGLLLLLALIIATPGIRLRQRLLYLAIGAIVSFALHIASILVIGLNVRALRPLIVLFASIGIDLFPILVWIALSARYWWPGQGAFQPSPDQS